MRTSITVSLFDDDALGVRADPLYSRVRITSDAIDIFMSHAQARQLAADLLAKAVDVEPERAVAQP